ncbi:MAG: hypothetical protein ACI4EC_02115 [Lachnospiraceae bacterium]
MMQFDRMTLGRKARELGFVRDTFEKVCRLAAVLNFIQKDALLSNVLALTCREQEVPHLYRWRDELRYTRHSLDFRSFLYYHKNINQSS